MDAVLDAFRTGDGVPYADYGTDLHEGQARFTRPMFDELLAGEWLPGCPEVHGRLLADPLPEGPRRRDRHGRRLDRGGVATPGRERAR